MFDGISRLCYSLRPALKTRNAILSVHVCVNHLLFHKFLGDCNAAAAAAAQNKMNKNEIPNQITEKTTHNSVAEKWKRVVKLIMK